MIKAVREPSSVVSSLNWTNPSNTLTYNTTYGTLPSAHYNSGNNNLVLGNFVGDDIPEDHVVKGIAVELWFGHTAQFEYPIAEPSPGQREAWVEIWASLDGATTYGSEPLMYRGYASNQPNNPTPEVAGASTWRFPNSDITRAMVLSSQFALIIKVNQGRTWDRGYTGIDPVFNPLVARLHAKNTFGDAVMNGLRLNVYTEYDLSIVDQSCDGDVTLSWN